MLRSDRFKLSFWSDDDRFDHAVILQTNSGAEDALVNAFWEDDGRANRADFLFQRVK